MIRLAVVQIVGSIVVHLLTGFGILLLPRVCGSFVLTVGCSRRHHCFPTIRGRRFSLLIYQHQLYFLLSDAYLENDLVAVQVPENFKKMPTASSSSRPRLCAVKPDGSVAPLCQRQDDVETDLFCDPREFDVSFWQSDVDLTDANIVAFNNGTTTVFGEGYYGQRPVPSLGCGPGYGASADEIWSVTEELLEQIRAAGVDIPVLDVGIAHGEKARAGAF